MLSGLVGEKNPPTSSARRILAWSGPNDPDGFHTCPRQSKCLSWKGTRGGEPPPPSPPPQCPFNLSTCIQLSN